MSLVTDSIERLVPYQAGKPIEELARELGVDNPIKLASNENPLGPSPRALRAAKEALSEVHRYPDGAGYALRKALAERHGVPLEEVLHGHGSNELIELIMRTFTTHEHHVVFGTPAFAMYPVTAMAHGVEFTAVATRDYQHDLTGMLEAVRPNTRLVIIDNPNNPTGTYVGREAVERFLREVPAQVIVVMDEAYFEYADAPDYPDCLKLRQLRERLIVLRTFSKIYGLAGFRVGYAIGPARLLGYVNRLRAPFNVGIVGQRAARAALTDEVHVEKSHRLNLNERRRLTRELGKMNVQVTPSQANFVFCNFARPAQEIYETMLRRGVILRPFAKLPSALRITVGTEEENTRMLQALGEVLS